MMESTGYQYLFFIDPALPLCGAFLRLPHYSERRSVQQHRNIHLKKSSTHGS